MGAAEGSRECWGVSETMTDPTTKAPRHSGHRGLLRKSGEVLGRREKPNKGKMRCLWGLKVALKEISGWPKTWFGFFHMRLGKKI